MVIGAIHNCARASTRAHRAQDNLPGSKHGCASATIHTGKLWDTAGTTCCSHFGATHSEADSEYPPTTRRKQSAHVGIVYNTYYCPQNNLNLPL